MGLPLFVSVQQSAPAPEMDLEETMGTELQRCAFGGWTLGVTSLPGDLCSQGYSPGGVPGISGTGIKDPRQGTN